MADKAEPRQTDPVRLRRAFWEFRCAIWCDAMERWGMPREQAAEEYAQKNPPPPLATTIVNPSP